MEEFLNQKIPRSQAPFKIKRLVFGSGEILPPLFVPITFEILENADFFIERRANEPYSANRFFCSAPVSTTRHIELLEELEREMKEATN